VTSPFQKYENTVAGILGKLRIYYGEGGVDWKKRGFSRKIVQKTPKIFFIIQIQL
jgi:hypothetical protein